MPGKWDRYEDEANEGKCAKYMVGSCHDVEGNRMMTVFGVYTALSMRNYETPCDFITRKIPCWVSTREMDHKR
jgi:hypothetical protein